VRLSAPTEQDTQDCGARLARTLVPDAAQMLQIQLLGDLGSGKTTLARGFLRALGHTGVVRSPTYTLVEIYALGALTVVHADLYRLRDPAELAALGLRDLAGGGHVWLIEWPQHAGGNLPAADLTVALAAHPAFHSIEIQAGTAIGSQWLARLRG
jgi:tRNA threonylcarbamoyladenosine biosynthesis protein TsaE